MSAPLHTSDTGHVIENNRSGSSSIVLVCEHASAFIPDEFDGLGIAPDDKRSHAAWDLGAMPVAMALSQRLDAILIASGVSRLVYDCNRPPSAKDAMPAQSETISVPGNANLTADQRRQRASRYYEPFQRQLAKSIAEKSTPIVVTIHSFTPIYHGRLRDVEIGVLHDSDTRLADAMLETSHVHTNKNVLRNAPYGPQDGVTHTLLEHAIPHGHLNVMLEVRNDLIETAAQQTEMAEMIANWLVGSCLRIDAKGVALCQA